VSLPGWRPPRRRWLLTQLLTQGLPFLLRQMPGAGRRDTCIRRLRLRLRLQRLAQLDAPLLTLHLAFAVPDAPNGRLSLNARTDEQTTAQQNVSSHG